MGPQVVIVMRWYCYAAQQQCKGGGGMRGHSPIEGGEWLTGPSMSQAPIFDLELYKVEYRCELDHGSPQMFFGTLGADEWVVVLTFAKQKPNA